MTGSEECRGPGCRAQVWWAQPADPASASRGMPVEAVGEPGGNVLTWRDGGGVLRYRVLTKPERQFYDAGMQQPPPGELIARSHYATCPDAGQFRRPRRQGAG